MENPSQVTILKNLNELPQIVEPVKPLDPIILDTPEEMAGLTGFIAGIDWARHPEVYHITLDHWFRSTTGSRKRFKHVRRLRHEFSKQPPLLK